MSELSPQAQLKQYTDAFGLAEGAKYFSEGLDMQSASIQHIKALKEQHAAEMTNLKQSHEAQLKSLTEAKDAVIKERDDLQSRLGAARASHGEATAVDTGAPKSTNSKSFASMIRPGTNPEPSKPNG